ncbi:MAG: alpha-ketoglutarate-dependent dioxygenase AlkB, partial [Archangium sp.]|nr:alpha-ketoglutarate-dependent dioxygenase AlkB [Archangium sp.]
MKARPSAQAHRPLPRLPPGLHYDPAYLTAQRRAAVLGWLGRITPLWELRYSHLRPPPDGQTQRSLLRPVYWLGNWQFACLDYYRPPHGVLNRCVAAEPFPRVLADIVKDVEAITRRMFRSVVDLPYGWELNTCLVNLYGRRLVDGAWVD